MRPVGSTPTSFAKSRCAIVHEAGKDDIEARKRVKKLLAGAVGAVVLLVLALGVWLATLDVNRFKPRLVAAVEEATGRDFDIAGEIRLKPSLVPTLSVDSVRFGNAPWAAHETMASAERFELVVALLPLLRREIAVERVVFEGVRVALETDADGRGNWVLPLADAAGEAREPGDLPHFDLRQIRLDDAVVEYRAAGGKPRVLQIAHLVLHTRERAGRVALEVAARLDDEALTLEGTLAPLVRLVRDEPFEVDVALDARGARLHLAGSIAAPLSARGFDLSLEGEASDLATLTGSVDDWPAGVALALRGRLKSEALETVRLEDVVVSFGSSSLKLDASVIRGREPLRVEAAIVGDTLDLTAFSGDAQDERPAGRVFSTDPLALDALATLDLDARLSLGRLVTRGAALETVAARVRVERGTLTVEDFSAVLEGGTLEGALELASARETPRWKQRLRARGVALAPLLNRGGENVATGGRFDLDLDVTGSGPSPAAIAGTANGRLLLDVRNVTVLDDGAALAAADLFLGLLDLLNPLSAKDAGAGTHVECAVVAFPIEQGRLASKTGIGIRTRQLSILGGGVVDLGTETIDIGVNPKPREGLGLNAAGIADFVRLGGTLSEPRPVTDAKGVASAGVKVGAALATGGLSLVAEGLFDRSGGDVDACAVARGDAALPGRSAAASEPSVLEKTGNALESAGSKVKGALKSLFGD